MNDSENRPTEKKVATWVYPWLNIAVIISSALAIILHPFIGLLTAALAAAAFFVSQRIAKEKESLLDELDSLTATIADQAKTISSQVAAIKSSRGKRYEGYENPRNLDIKAFVDRLGYSDNGPVIVAYPQNRVQPVDDFGSRLYGALREAEWPLNQYMAENHDVDVSAYGVTLKVIVENKDAIPSHFRTLKYALEKSGCPVSVVIDIQDHTCEEVFLIVGAEPP
jgi:hypothetical protein